MKNNRQKGAQVVEFALVLPILLLIVFAVIDFGFLVYNKAIITNASREAARSGTILSAAAWNPGAIRQVACNHAGSVLITVGSGTRNATCTGTADPTITVTPGAGAPPDFGDPVVVTVSYRATGFTLGAFAYIGSAFSTIGREIILVSRTEMNHE